MSPPNELIIHTDGAARGNPGPAAYAYTIAGSQDSVIEEAGCLGTMTNNQAEYIALVKALEHAKQLGTHHHLRIHSDSELLVKQMNGQYRVKDTKLQDYYKQAVALVGLFDDVHIRHVRRSENSQADRLCNLALDGERRGARRQHVVVEKPAGATPSSGVRSATPSVSRDAKTRGRVLECLKHAAGKWAKGDAADPPPESVLDDIWNILAEGTHFGP
jgi:ribonuclease HI